MTSTGLCTKGLHPRIGKTPCAACRREYNRLYYDAHKAPLKGRAKSIQRKLKETLCKSGLHRYTPPPGNKQGCRECYLEGKRAWARKAYAANPEHFRAKVKNYYAARPGLQSKVKRGEYLKHGDKIRAAVKRAYAANPERVKLRVAQWQADNHAHVRAWHRRWKSKNPEAVRVAGQKRRIRLRAAGADGISLTEWQQVLARFTSGGKTFCAYCGCACMPTMDHVVPLARGGRHEPGNVLPACSFCNASKGARLIHEWKRASTLLAPDVLQRLVRHTEQHLDPNARERSDRHRG